jgi:hypothetical protein
MNACEYSSRATATQVAQMLELIPKPNDAFMAPNIRRNYPGADTALRFCHWRISKLELCQNLPATLPDGSNAVIQSLC